MVLKNEVTSFVKTTTLARDTRNGTHRPRVAIPKVGITPDELREEMKAMQKKEANAEKDGNIFALTYTVNDESYKIQKEAFDKFEGRYCVSNTFEGRYCVSDTRDVRN